MEEPEEEEEGSFNEDVLGGTGISDVLLVVLLERPPEGKEQKTDQVRSKV